MGTTKPPGWYVTFYVWLDEHGRLRIRELTVEEREEQERGKKDKDKQ